MRSHGSILIAVLAGLAPLAACSAPAAPAAMPDAVPVLAGSVVRKDVPVEIREIGTVQAYATVGIRAQVSGLLTRVHFREGEDVKAGDLLFALDPRPYETALASARAALDRDTALRDNSRQEEERYAGLAKKEYVNQDEYDRIRAAAAALAATVAADEAAVKKATLDLEYCTIRAPIAGRTGQLMVNGGNVIKANSDDPLVVINQLEPIYVAFSVPEPSLSLVKERFAASPLPVTAAPSPQGRAPIPGRLTFLDNAVDRSTGTFRLKATFENRDRALWPGQYVDVSLAVATQPGALVIPTQAIQTGQQGPYVFVVKGDATVELRTVGRGAAVGAETIVTKGLSEGETVVTDGQLRLVPGSRVKVQAGLSESRT
ncbi:MAG TPA: efflux RND transporter periplasmic adaptor subunit [Verrucomicrobiae bacterium]|nr:efflux RND transporter periplasmic adaptor subunit [Verrucomicrobiae bacterium]